nr:integrase, catalytic region, zinc finger, CCHC-type, peptidase aspartic, catalytic [Tanacetum cinerariifolium]
MTLEVHKWSSSAHKELKARVFENTSESMKNTSGTSVTPHVDKPKLSVVTPHSKKLHASTLVDFVPNKQSSASIRTNLITNSQRYVIVKENVSSNMVTASSTGNIKLLINFVWKFLGTVRFGNDHIAAILGYGDLKWGNIKITRVYFVEGLGHNLFLVGQFCDANLEVVFRRNTCFIRDLDGVNLLKGNRSTNLYTINLYDMVLTSPICLMARATPTKSWLWHQRLSHLNFDTIKDFAKNDLVSGLLNFKYAKEHLCPSCEKGKSIRASHPSKPVLNSKQRLHLLHMDLCGPMRVASINGKRALCYLKNDRKDIGKLGAKGDIGFFIGYSANYVAYRMYNRRTKKIMETMNVTFELELTYALSIITPQRQSKRDLDILFEPLHNEYLGGRPSEAPRAIPATLVLQNLQALTASMSFFCTGTNKFLKYSNVDALSQQHAQQQRNLSPSPTASVIDNVSNAMFEGDLFVNPFATPSTD